MFGFVGRAGGGGQPEMKIMFGGPKTIGVNDRLTTENLHGGISIKIFEIPKYV